MPAPRDNPRRPPDEVVASAGRAAKRLLEEALEKAFEIEAEELLARPDLRAEPAGHVRLEALYNGVMVDVKAPRLRLPDGEFLFPSRFEEMSRDPRKIKALRRAGVPINKIDLVLRGISGGRVPGTSASNVSRLVIKAGDDALQALEERRYDGTPPIVAVSLDGTAIGNTGRKRTVMIVIGVKADGSRWALDTFVVPRGEPAPHITPHLQSLLRRGISRDVYWVADGGAGIRAALQSIGAENVGMCTTHAVRLAMDTVEDEADERRIRTEIDRALRKDAWKDALAGLDAVEDELRRLGYQTAANSLAGNKARMVTTQKLGLTGELRNQLRSTNALVEGQNDTVKKQLRDVSNWQDKTGKDGRAGDRMRLRWVTETLLDLEKSSWNRLADTESLVALGERVGLSGLDLETIVAGLPPSLAVENVKTPVAETEGRGDPGARWLADAPGAAWIGASGALAKLGATAGAPVGAIELTRAMQGRHTGSGQTVRTASTLSIDVGVGSPPPKARVPGVVNLKWRLTASPALMTRWRSGTEEQRGELEAAFWDAASAAIEEATRTTQPGHGFAAAAALSRPPPDADGVLRIEGVTVGVVKGERSKLNSPAKKGVASAIIRRGEDAAKAALDSAFARLEPVALSARPPQEPSVAFLAGIEWRALERAADMVGVTEGLAATASAEAGARAELGAALGEATDWWNANRAAAARQIAAARTRHETQARGNLWFPLAPEHRLLLGEERARDLRADAARLAGRATVDRDLATELRGFEGDPLAGLRPAVDRADNLAAAIGARLELRRRHLFESAPTERTGERPPPDIPVLDSLGRPAKPPVERYRRALGRQHELALRRYSEMLAPAVAELSPKELGYLVRDLGDPWQSLDRDAGAAYVRLTERRHAETRQLIVAEYHAGRDLELARSAEARRDAAGAFEASHGSHQREAERLRTDLARTDEEIDDARRPAVERLVAKHVEAVVYDASFAKIQERLLTRAPETAEVGMGVD